MKVNLACESIRNLQLKYAILLYSHPGFSESKESVATLHDIIGGVIKEGKLIDLAELKGKLEEFATERKEYSGYIPPGVLSYSSSKLIWWRAAHSNPILFKTAFKKLNEINGKRVPHPSLIFKASSLGLSVYAIKGDLRPNLETELYYAPYFNIHESHRVCLPGGAERPKIDIDSIPKWESLFFESHFSHAGGGGGSEFPDGHNALWPYLAKRKKERFPDWILRSTKLTLKDIVNHE